MAQKGRCLNLLKGYSLLMPSKLKERPGLRQLLANTSWLFGDRALRMGMGLVVGVWVARYLGPEQFGLLNYAQAFVALFTALATLGLDGIVVRDLVKHYEQRDEILGTTFALRLVAAMLAILAQVIIIYVIQPRNILLHLVVAILGSAMVFQAFDFLDLWFQSCIQSRQTVIAKNAAFLVIAGIRLALIATRQPLVAFALALLGETALGAFFLLLRYKGEGGDIRAWRVSAAWAKSLIRDGWPMILSGLAVMIYMRIDQIMLGQMRGNVELGVYSAAVRLSEVWYFIPMAITSSVAPVIIASRQEGEVVYYGRIQKLLRLMAFISVCIALPMTFLAPFLVTHLFGTPFAAAGPILAVHIWTAVFVFLGVPLGPWIVAEGLMKVSLYRSLAGGVVNIILNLYLIPRLGGMGAALATLAAQSMASLFFNALDPRTRRIFWLELRALNFLGK
jgi:PST family polysaccharide transporter